MFPEGLFYILSRKHGFALDVYDGQTTEGSNLIVWPQKFEDSDNQLWTYEGGRLTNKKSGLVMDISSSAFKKDKTIVQKKSKPSKQSQEWIYDQGFICSKEYPSLVLDIRGDSEKGGAQVLLYKRKDTDNLNQLWQFESYQQFENSLGLAESAIALHKKESFGQPRLGYAAEVGVPPELKAIPENNRIAGVGNNVSATPTTDTSVDNSRIDPTLAQYGSFYGGTTTTPPAPQPGPQPSGNTYPPPPQSNNAYPPPQSNNAYPPPPQSNNAYPPPPPPQAGPVPSHNYPPPPPLSNNGYTSPGNNAYPPPPGSNYPQGSPAYPAQNNSGYPLQPPSPSNYQQQPSSAGYPAPPSPSNYLNNNSGFGSPPPSHPGYPGSPPQLSSSPPGYPSAFPSVNNAYPPPNAPSTYPSHPSHNAGGSFYQQQPVGMPDNTNYGYPPPPNPLGQPPVPGNRPQDQYNNYPSYPQ